MYLIYTVKQDAVNLQQRLSDSLGLPAGSTLKYGNVIKHQILNRWALVINNGANAHLTPIETGNLTSLDADWYPEPEI